MGAQPIDKPRRPYRGGKSRIWSIDDLPMPRAWFHGPKWKPLCGVTQRPIAEVNPPWANRVRANRRFVLVFTFEEEVRERVLEQLAPGVFAMWSDPREQLGLG